MVGEATRDQLVQGVTDAALSGDHKALARASALLAAFDEPKEAKPRKADKAREVKTITRGEYERIIAAIDLRYPSGIRNRAILAMLWATGARVGEILNARVDAIDAESHELQLPAEGKRGARRIALPRGKAWDELHEAMLAWESIREPSATYLFTTMHENVRHKKPGTERTGRICNSAIERVLNLYTARAGTKHVTPHMLRHTWATAALRRGWTLADVARQLGHASPSITAKFYAHSDTARLHELQAKDGADA